MEEYTYEDFYQLEFDRIPAFFRSSDKKIKIVKIIIALAVLAEIIMLLILPSTQKIVSAPIPYAVYSIPLTRAMMAMFFVVLAILLWAGIAIQFEKRAVKAATKAHRDYSFYYRERVKNEYNEMKLKN